MSIAKQGMLEEHDEEMDRLLKKYGRCYVCDEVATGDDGYCDHCRHIATKND